MSAIKETINSGEDVVVVLNSDKKGKRTIDDKGRFEITLIIKDRHTGDTETYEVKPS